MKTYRITLKVNPFDRFHIGERVPYGDTVLQRSSRIIHSDTIFSALVNIFKKVYGDPQPIIDLFERDGAQLSSAFYLLQKDNAKVMLFPRPCLPITNEDKYKDIKRISLVSEGVLKQMTQIPDLTSDTYWGDHGWKITNSERSLLQLHADERKKVVESFPLFEEDTMPHVKVHTKEEDGRFFNVGYLYVAQAPSNVSIHFYILLKLSEEFPQLLTCIKLLEHEGLGGERSSGSGLFRGIDIEEWNEPFPESSLGLSLSLVNPTSSELSKCRYYQVLQRGGRKVGSKERLQIINMLQEGAITEKVVKGRTVDISAPSLKSLRYGKSFLINIKE